MSYTIIPTPADSRYTIRSFGNGWAYEIDDHETSDTLWFQDHVADIIRKKTKDFTNMTVIDQYFENLEG
jgi:hypothetical protein